MSLPNQESSNPIEASRPRRSGPGQTSLPSQNRLQWLKSLQQECRYDYARIKEFEQPKRIVYVGNPNQPQNPAQLPRHFWRSLQRRLRKGQKLRSRRSSEGTAWITNALWWIRSSAFWLKEVDHCHSTMAIMVEDEATEFTPRSFITRTSKSLSLRQSQANSIVCSTDPLYDLDPQIELTLRTLRKARNIVVSNSSNSVSNSPITNISDFVEYSSTNNFAEQMENNERTLKELATPDVVYQPWCIQYPQLEPAQTYELKSGLIHLLPKFHSLAREDSTSI
ncbi:hypothetical protein CR513_11115, partial [Mucuna pruriens]